MKKVVMDLFWGRPVGKHAEGLVKDVIWLFVKSQGLMQNNPKPTAALHREREIMLFIGKPKGRSMMISNGSSHHYECASAQNLHWCKANLHGPWPTLVVSHDCDPSNESYLYHFCGPFCICPGRLIKQSNTHILVIFTRVCCFALLIRVWGWLETRLQVALG